MTVNDVKNVKAAIKAEMLRRNGYGSLAAYGGSSYDFSQAPAVGQKTKPEYGEKTIDLLLKICDYKDLRLTRADEPIPTAFNKGLLDFITKLSKEESTGESAATVANLFPDRRPETSSCRGNCTGLCVGNCTNHCNGCTSCTASCGTGCASGCNTNCKGGAMKEMGH